MTNDAHAELERLRRLRHETQVGLSALAELGERMPDDDLQLCMITKLERRLADRIAWIEERVWMDERFEAIAAE